MSHVDRYELQNEENKNRKRSKSRKSSENAARGMREEDSGRPSSISNRPPWNNDTYIEGYDDVDDNGRYKNKKAGGMPKSVDRNQEELTKNWTATLRGEQHHEK